MGGNTIPLPWVIVVVLLGAGDVDGGLDFGLLAGFGWEVSFVEEAGEEYEVGEVHGHGEFDVEVADAAGAGRGGDVVVSP